MKNVKTIIGIICLIILGSYAAHECSYFADKTNNTIDEQIIKIDSIGVNEVINNVSIDKGVYISNQSTDDKKVIFGHRTMHGSPFIRIAELNAGDDVTIYDNGKEMHYTIKSYRIVDSSYKLDIDEEDSNLFIISCHPVGSCEKRIIYEAEYDNTTTCGDVEEPDYIWNSIIILIGFISIGGVVSYVTKDRRIMVTVIIMTVFIIMCMFVPEIGKSIPIIQ